MQQDCGKWMGMAALLCDSAGWWPLASLYSNLSQMAAAGVRQDLLPLMRVPGMDAAKDRALFRAGLRDAQVIRGAAPGARACLCGGGMWVCAHPVHFLTSCCPEHPAPPILSCPLQALATANDTSLAKTLAPVIAQQMRTRSSLGKQQGGGAQAAANYAAAIMARRGAAALVQASREHLREQAREVAALAADIQEDEAAAAAVAADMRGGPQGAQHQQAVAGGGLSPDELAHIQHAVARAGGGQGATSDRLAAVEVTIAPAAQLQWTQGWVK